jgi:photosystem II stability/assembly factor-like uncharacterized protein
MRTKINRILITILIFSLLSLGSYALTTGQTISSFNYLPLVSLDRSGWLGPDGGALVAIVVDPLNPQTVFAGSWGAGMFKSIDSGITWQAINQGLDNLYINSLAIDPNQPSILYAGTYRSQVYKSVDGGLSWFWSGYGIQDKAVVYTIAIDPQATNTLYIGTRGVSNNGNPPWSGVAYKSVDAGATWTPMLEDVGGADAQDWVYSIAINPSSNFEIFAATHEHGPYRSNNYGAYWYAIDDGISDYSGRAIVVEPNSPYPSTLYYGVWHYDGVYKSTTSGNDWVITNPGIYATKIYGMSIDPLHLSTVYLATFNRGILRTVDGGVNWLPTGLWNDGVYTVAIDPISVGNLFAGTAGDGLFRSLDGGISWQASSTGINNSMVTSIIVSPSDSHRLYTSIYGGGVMVSTDTGQTWSDMNTGLGDKSVHVLLMSPDNPNLLYALTDTAGLYQDDLNNNIGWVHIGDGLPLSTNPTPAYPADHPFATREEQESLVSESDSQGIEQPTVENLMCLAFSPSVPNIAYLGTGGSGVYRSTNAGLSWQPAGLTGEDVWSIAVDPVDSSLVYAATSTPGSMKVSTDGGVTWIDADLGVTFYTLVTSSEQPGTLYAGTDSGMFRYQNASWIQLGLAGKLVTAIAVDPAQANILYAGTDSGAYYTLDGGLTWQPGPTELNGITIQSIIFDPINPHVVYFATKTHGTYMTTIHY